MEGKVREVKMLSLSSAGGKLKGPPVFFMFPLPLPGEREGMSSFYEKEFGIFFPMIKVIIIVTY